jgi:hypothetical protein
MKKHEIPVHKTVVSPTERAYLPVRGIVLEYLEKCTEKNQVLSFNEYGDITEDKKKQRLKRLFNEGRRFNEYKDELKKVALNKDLWEEFLSKLI